MAKFHGPVGYGITQENPADSGVWEDTIVELAYYGDVVRNTRKLADGEGLNNDVSVGNSISIIADAYANQNFLNMKYVRWAGVYWTVTDVEVQRPRLLLSLGKVYNGPKA